jgi:Proteasome activator pa28 beta subunit
MKNTWKRYKTIFRIYKIRNRNRYSKKNNGKDAAIDPLMFTITPATLSPGAVPLMLTPTSAKRDRLLSVWGILYQHTAKRKHLYQIVHRDARHLLKNNVPLAILFLFPKHPVAALLVLYLPLSSLTRCAKIFHQFEIDKKNQIKTMTSAMVHTQPFTTFFGKSFCFQSDKKRANARDMLVQWQNQSFERAKTALHTDLPALILQMNRVLEEGEAPIESFPVFIENNQESYDDEEGMCRKRSASVFMASVGAIKKKRVQKRAEDHDDDEEYREAQTTVNNTVAVERVKDMWDKTRTTFCEALHILGILDHWVQLCKSSAGRGSHFQESVQELISRELSMVRKGIEEHLDKESRYAITISSTCNPASMVALVSHQWTQLWISWSNVRNLCSVLHDTITKNSEQLTRESR